MKIEFVGDKEMIFWGIILNLNREGTEVMGYDLEKVFSNYTISKTTKKILKQGVFSANTQTINATPELRKIKETNWNAWLAYWAEAKNVMDKIKTVLQKNIKSFDFTSLSSIEKFFNDSLPPKIRIILCPGVTTLFGKGTVDFRYSEDVVLLFPRNYRNFSEETVFKDFAVFIHELVHFMQTNIYFKEDRYFIEAVTRVFAPKGIIISSGLMPENSPESRMKPIIENALKMGKTYVDVREELQNAMKAQ